MEIFFPGKNVCNAELNHLIVSKNNVDFWGCPLHFQFWDFFYSMSPKKAMPPRSHVPYKPLAPVWGIFIFYPFCPKKPRTHGSHVPMEPAYKVMHPWVHAVSMGTRL